MNFVKCPFIEKNKIVNLDWCISFYKTSLADNHSIEFKIGDGLFIYWKYETKEIRDCVYDNLLCKAIHD